MRPRGAGLALQRDRRKQDLLLASQLARGQVVGAFDELADRADVVVDRVVRVRMWLSNPLAWTAGSVAGALMLGVALRRVRGGGVLRWAWLAWKFWRSAGPVLALYRTSVVRRQADRRS
jgi:hypothetical protein